MAAHLGIGACHWGAYLRGADRIPGLLMLRFLTTYGVNPLYLLRGSPPMFGALRGRSRGRDRQLATAIRSYLATQTERPDG
jgi:hypothetical protein